MIFEDITVRSSSLSGYADCPRRWAARHLRGMATIFGYKLRDLPSSIGAAIGSGTHSVIGNDLEHKMVHGTLPDFALSEEIGMHELETRIGDEGVMWDDVSPNLSDAQLQVRRLARTYRAQVGETIKPVAVERRLKARHSTGIVISGQQDLVVSDPLTLRDVKTGKGRGANHAQYGSYSRLLRAHGQPVTHIFEDFIRRVPLKNKQPDVLSVEYDLETCEQQTEATIARIDRDLKAFTESGDRDAFLANPSSTLCSDRFCPAAGSNFCPFWRAK